MNNNELKEIRSQFKKTNKNFTISRLATAYVVPKIPQTEVPVLEIRDWDDFREAEQEIYLSIFKKALSGKMGKNLMEYVFDREAGEENEYQKKLYSLNQEALSNEEGVKEFLQQVMDNTGYAGKYLITIASCEYAVPELDKNGEVLPDGNRSSFRFLLLCTNPVDLTDIGLFYNQETEAMEKKVDEDMHVLPAVMDAFMFPVFADRAADISRMLYYTAKPKSPNEELILSLSGKEAEMPYDREQDSFSTLLQDLAQEELSFGLVRDVYQNIRGMIEDSEENEAFEISKPQMKELLADSGLSAGKLERFSAVYDHCVGEDELRPINMMDTQKMTVKMPDIQVSVKKEAAGKVRTEVVDGKRYLMIEMDEGLQVNGLEILR